MRNAIDGGQLAILSDDAIYEIHLAVLKLLQSYGARIEEGGALKLLQEAGAEVDFEKCWVKIPQHLVEESIRKAPKSVRLAGRDPMNDFVLEGSKVHFRACGLAPNIIDLETGLRRESTIADVKNGARLSDALSEIDCANEVSAANDVPTNAVGLYKQEAMMSNTTKHILLAREDSVEIERQRIELAALVAGGDDKLRERPIVSMFVEPVSPLLLGREDTQTIIEWARAELPIVCVSCPVSGATAPVTLAGTIVQGAAESLVGNVIAQLTNPGTPFIFGSLGFSMDMRNGLLATGGIESMLMCAASGQLARYYRLPSIGFAGGSASNTLDTQAITEASLSMTIAALSGINLIQGIGYLESGLTGSYEMLAICNEIARMLRRALEGVRVNEDTLGVDAIKKVGLGQSFLGLEHTRKYFSTEHLVPQLMSRLPFKEWHETGEKKLEACAREKVKTILKDHHVQPIDEGLKKEMKNLISAAERKHTGEF